MYHQQVGVVSGHIVIVKGIPEILNILVAKIDVMFVQLLTCMVIYKYINKCLT